MLAQQQNQFMGYRSFANEDEALAADWHGAVEIADPADWVLGAAIGRGESGSFHITSRDGRRGACKPAFATNGVPRAAHEKIAADLAYLLGLPVPPTCLWRNPADGALFTTSLWAFRQALTWGEAKPRLSATFLQNAAAGFSVVRVFHTWIGDTDHGGNDGNVVINAETTDESPSFAVIDHAFSMLQNPHFEAGPVQIVPMGYVPQDLCDTAATAAAVAAINHLEAKMIENTVGRLPADFLPPERAEAIIGALLRRRQELAPVFGVPGV